MSDFPTPIAIPNGTYTLTPEAPKADEPIAAATPEPAASSESAPAILVQAAYMVKAVIGPRRAADKLTLHRPVKLTEQTLPIRWHDTVVNCLERLNQATDGSMVMLIPGTSNPFGMLEYPYELLRQDATVHVVPNNASEVGAGASATKAPIAEAAQPE